MTTGKALNGKPDAGNPRVRFDEGEVASAATPRHVSLLYNIHKLTVVAAVAAGMAFPLAAKTQDIADDFANPPREYGVNCWWWWLNGNTDKAAIASELAAMKDRGFQGAMIYDAGGWNHIGHRDTVPPGPKFGWPEWMDLLLFACDEAEKNGLELSFTIQSGWNLGGPDVKPEHIAKQLVFSKTVMHGGENGVTLPKPYVRLGFYRDIAVLAFPVNDRAVASEPIHFLDNKIGATDRRHTTDCRYELDNRERDDAKNHPVPYLVPFKSIRDISSSMRADGTLGWKCPSGKWLVLRIGYTCTSRKVAFCSATWGGYVLDYLSTKALDAYLEKEIVPILSHVGRHKGTTLKYIETDSWECGAMNWTDDMASSFERDFGYNPIPWLALLSGVVVDDMETSHAFLADFRKEIGMRVSEHYRRMAEFAHAHGMGINPESGGPHPAPLDALKNYAYSDIVMSEFWLPDPPRTEMRYYVKQASSAAHIYGKRIVGAESFTSIGPQWNDLLWRSQKRAFDHEICAGLNRAYLHSFTSSPASMGLPGQEYFAGTHINPRVTWWNDSKPVFDYFMRVQSIVQNGQFVADVLYYYGDHVPNVYLQKATDLGHAMPGFDYDVTDENALCSLVVDSEGWIATPKSPRYRVLALPDHGVLSLAALKAVKRLLSEGATVVGSKPLRCVSLKGGASAQKEFASIASELWGDGSAGIRKVGKGRLVVGETARTYLLSQGVKQDFSAGNVAEESFDYIHYKLGCADAWFVSNQTLKPLKATCEFRACRRTPELWDPLTGERRALRDFTRKDGVTAIPLEFDPCSAYFIVFRDDVPIVPEGENFPQFKTVLALEGEWKVEFDPAWGGPGEVVFPSLVDWTTSPISGIKYYSGAAKYSKGFKFAKRDGVRYRLELGQVLDVGVATVRLNGKNTGTGWTKPFRFDVTEALIDGENVLEVKVVNSWYNRVLGDQLHVDGDKTYTKTNIELANRRGKRGKPSPSGLLGPVVVKACDSVQRMRKVK